MMSACVKWAKERLDEFNDLLAKQLGSVRQGTETWRDCVARAKEHAGMMSEVGLDFRDLVALGMGQGTGTGTGTGTDSRRENERGPVKGDA